MGAETGHTEEAEKGRGPGGGEGDVVSRRGEIRKSAAPWLGPGGVPGTQGARDTRDLI